MSLQEKEVLEVIEKVRIDLKMHLKMSIVNANKIINTIENLGSNPKPLGAKNIGS